MEANGANESTNYEVSGTGGFTDNPSVAQLQANGANVILTVADTSGFTLGQTLIINVVEGGGSFGQGFANANQVTDLAGNSLGANKIATYTAAGFYAPAVTGAALSTVRTSQPFIISGLGVEVSGNISISCPEGNINCGYSKDGVNYTSTSGTVADGNSVTVRVTSSNAYSTTVTATLTIDNLAGTFDVTTIAPPPPYDPGPYAPLPPPPVPIPTPSGDSTPTAPARSRQRRRGNHLQHARQCDSGDFR